MRRLLLRLYPAPWRARYGDEFAALLEERSLGPSDVADVVHGALDAHLRLRGRGNVTQSGRRSAMSTTPDPGQPDASRVPDRRSRRRPFVILAAAVVVTAVLAVGTVATAQYLALRPDLPPRADLATVRALVAVGGVSELSQVGELNWGGETLTVTLVSGGRLRVDGVTDTEFQSLAEAAASNLERTDPGRYLSFSTGGNSEMTQLGILATVYLPSIPLVVVAVLALWIGLRRRAALRPAD
jgi:hypothetical protein